MNKTRISTKNRNYLNQILVLKNTINELKYSIQWFNSRLKQAKESETLENGSFEITELEEQKKKKKKIEPKGFLGHIKVSSLGSSRKGRETGRGQSLFEKNNGQNFPKLEERNGYTNLGTSTNFN